MRAQPLFGIIGVLVLGIGLGTMRWAFAEPVVGPPADPALLCMAATGFAEQTESLPQGLLRAIAKVESGRLDAATGQVAPWPWTINANGTGHFYATEQDAIAAARAFRGAGITSLDVGCLQINLQQHPYAFASLEDAFSPPQNALYAARFLRRLKTQLGGWNPAIAGYHSQTPSLGLPYQQRVLAVWQGGEPQIAFATPPAVAPSAKNPVSPKQDSPVHPPAHPLPAHYAAGGFQFSALRGRAVILPATASSGSMPGARAGASGGVAGRGLAAYRATPILINGAHR